MQLTAQARARLAIAMKRNAQFRDWCKQAGCLPLLPEGVIRDTFRELDQMEIHFDSEEDAKNFRALKVSLAISMPDM